MTRTRNLFRLVRPRTSRFSIKLLGPIESKAWTKYYKGTGPLPTYDPQFKGDICGIVEALDKAAADPEVKNFVLDLTCNNGGELSVLMTITALLAGKTAVSYERMCRCEIFRLLGILCSQRWRADCQLVCWQVMRTTSFSCRTGVYSFS